MNNDITIVAVLLAFFTIAGVYVGTIVAKKLVRWPVRRTPIWALSMIVLIDLGIWLATESMWLRFGLGFLAGAALALLMEYLIVRYHIKNASEDVLLRELDEIKAKKYEQFRQRTASHLEKAKQGGHLGLQKPQEISSHYPSLPPLPDDLLPRGKRKKQ